MVIYTLLLKLQDNSSENVAKTRELLLGMQGKVESIRELRVEADIRRAESSYDIALIAKFDSMEGVQAYLPHPAHVAVGSQLKSELVAMASVCYEE